jgi:arylsulfatase A-like enzyme
VNKRSRGRGRFLRALALAAPLAWAFPALCAAAEHDRPPNFVIILLDDSGWGDFSPFTPTSYQTPNVERLAAEGARFFNFYVPQAICSASRAALLSGAFPGRTKVFGADPPRARGLDPKFATLGEVLKKRGYRTAVFGKWHIGDQPETRPWNRGFDESCGLLYSNDMWEHHPSDPERWGRYPLQFWEGDRVSIERITSEHQPMLTTWYTEHAVSFIERHWKVRRPAPQWNSCTRCDRNDARPCPSSRAATDRTARRG